MRHMKKKAKLLFEDRVSYPDGAILEMRIWQLPESDTERPHGLKYSLFFGRDGQRIVGYDNERGKGDHRHYRDREEPYAFSTMEQMMADFLDDVERERGEA
jgi:uncharacterized protein DUF6516